ncbi:uncharacterized protein F4807DRAFT_170223 [Annulohypoxylon truncatum]|uniref:uncharacterized protein n=1 Tax=Annulohypoxylon truncatum TaxID=327061 RepID=UPI002008A689|nr:uncharacterized protein F4807DRAFT_170223 [Annulohypoxylon truncatum]KAI1207904.1 hypothetical protein F4807DRAFT_170223 [Annulohypoxylon truncatum]
MWNLFSTLTGWAYTKQDSAFRLGLSLLLSAYSPSDREHYFRDHRFDDDNKTYYDSPRVYHHDPRHGWYFGEQVRPCLGAKERLFGKPLSFDFRYIGARDLPSLPKVGFITTLIIPRQFYRPIPNMGLILRSLPKLETLRYEPWDSITSNRSWRHEVNLLEILDALPRTVTRFSGYRDSNDVFNTNGTVFLFPDPGLKLFHISQRLKELDLSFIIDAKWFFAPFGKKKKNVSWDNLEGLTLTSDSLSSKAPPKEVDELLRSAAQAALRMPKLQMMELWFGQRGEARIFCYTRFKDNSLVEWWDTSLLSATLRPNVRKSWQMVADKYVRGHLDFEVHNILPRHIKSRGSILPYLKRRDRTLTSGSLQQIIWETTELRRVRRHAPANAGAHTVQC